MRRRPPLNLVETSHSSESGRVGPQLGRHAPAWIAVTIALLLLGLTVQAAAAQRPNIVFVLTDDQAPWTIGVSGNPQAKTPNIDRLAREGAYLVNYFTPTPVCSPARACLMTSRYGSEVGITDWINPKTEPNLGLDPATVTWPEVLAGAGYTTGLVGKWHLGELAQFHPNKTGFSYFMGFLGGACALKNPKLEINGQSKKFDGFTVNIVTDNALEFIRTNKDRTFVLCLHYRDPHAPWLPLPEEDWKGFKDLEPAIPNPDYPKLDTAKVKQKMREYLGSVASMDRNLGRVLGLLDQLDLSRKTAVIFTSDNGYNMGHNGIWHKGNGHWVVTDPPAATKNIPLWQRPNMYDNSLRLPMVMRWPGRIKPGTVVTQPITHLDCYPTLLALAGVPLPQGVTLRGRNFLPLVEGRQVEWDNDLYAEYSTHQQSQPHMRMYRTPQWKLVRDFLNPERDELYNLGKDPAETTNLIGRSDPEVQTVVASLHAKILAKMREVNDPVLKLVDPSGN